MVQILKTVMYHSTLVYLRYNADMAQDLTNAEKETICRFSEEPEDCVTFETFNKRHALRLIRDGATVKRTNTHGKHTYWTLTFPKKWFRWPRKPSESRSLAAKARHAARIAQNA